MVYASSTRVDNLLDLGRLELGSRAKITNTPDASPRVAKFHGKCSIAVFGTDQQTTRIAPFNGYSGTVGGRALLRASNSL